jgi:transcriptional regulator with XRE-family HTH domain
VKANVRGESLIKAWREYFRLTQAELALKAGMKQSALARLESGNASPRTATLSKLSEALRITVEQLID